MAETAAMPPAWADLIEALTILSQHGDKVSPFNCAHDTLYVMANPADFTDPEIAQLEDLGFHASRGDENFYSFRYGSA